MGQGRPGPAALECAIDVWGKRAPMPAISAPAPPRGPRIDDDAVRRAARLLAKAKRVLIVAGGGAQGAAPEVTLISQMLQAPVLGYRRGRGVLDSRDPLSVTLPLGRELWAEADAVLGVGSRMLYPLRQWGVDRDLKMVRIDADKQEPARLHKPNVALIGDAAPILRRLIDELAKVNAKRASRKEELQERQAKLRARLEEKIGPQLGFVDAIRAELPEDGIYRGRGDASWLCRPHRHAGLSPTHLSLARLSGQSRLGLCHRAGRATRPFRRAGASRSTATAGFFIPATSLPPPCATVFRWWRWCSATTPTAMCAASRRSVSATG